MNYEWYESTKKTLQNTCHIVSQLFSHPQLPTHLWKLLKQGKRPAQSSGLVGMPHHRLCSCVTITHTCVSTCLGVGTSIRRSGPDTLESLDYSAATSEPFRVALHKLPYQGNTGRIWSSGFGEGWKGKSESTISTEQTRGVTGRLQYSHNSFLRLWLQQRFGFYAGIHWKAQSSMFSCKNGDVRKARGLVVLVLITAIGRRQETLVSIYCWNKDEIMSVSTSDIWGKLNI